MQASIDLILDEISARELAELIEGDDDPAMASVRRERIALLGAWRRDGKEKNQD